MDKMQRIAYTGTGQTLPQRKTNCARTELELLWPHAGMGKSRPCHILRHLGEFTGCVLRRVKSG